MRIKKTLKTLADTRLSGLFSILYQISAAVVCGFCSVIWFLRGARKPDGEERKTVAAQVTFIFKSFERQKMAKRLYRSIRSYYPEARVIIADDSRKPLALRGDDLTVIQLPFNSGLSYGLKRALELVETPYVFRMDDDEKLSLHTRAGKQAAFLDHHPEVDLVSIPPLSVPRQLNTAKAAARYLGTGLRHAAKELILPHGTEIEKDYYVVGKAPNIYIARTDKLREVGFDENIRMLDHNDFFYRAAGTLVSVMDVSSSVFHLHDPFMREYMEYRRDIAGDVEYIRRRLTIDKMKKEAGENRDTV